MMIVMMTATAADDGGDPFESLAGRVVRHARSSFGSPETIARASGPRATALLNGRYALSLFRSRRRPPVDA